MLIALLLVALIAFTVSNLYFLHIKTPKLLKKEIRGYLGRYSIYLIGEIVIDLERVFQMFFACFSLEYFARGDKYSILKPDGYLALRYVSTLVNIFLPLLLTILRLTEP